MRRLTYSVACSFDSCIAGPAGTIDWLVMNDDAGATLAETVSAPA